VLAWLRSDPRFADLEHKESLHDEQPFLRMKVKLKREIVTMGVPQVDPKRRVGTYVRASDWNSLLDDPELTLLDTRNDYECAIGSFRGALDPGITNFRDFPRWVRENLDPRVNRKVAMFCTGGIRCEKPRPICWSRDSRRCTTSRAEFSNISRTFPQARASGKVSALCLTSVLLSTRSFGAAATISAMPVATPSVKTICGLPAM
jgi:hypothetical protein